MTKTRLKSLSVALLLLIVGSMAAGSQFTSDEPSKTKTTEDAALKEIANYREWTRATEQPVVVFDSLTVAG